MLYTLAILAGSISTSWFIALSIGRRFREKKLCEETILRELQNTGKPVPDTQKIKGTVVVCGGSIAGLLAARICHDHFDRVVIVEPEAWLFSADGKRVDAWKQTHERSRVVQYHSLQSQSPTSLMLYRRLFRNFDEEAQKSNIIIRTVMDANLRFWGYYFPLPHHVYPDGLPQTIYDSRQSTETLVRRLLLDSGDYPNIECVVGVATDIHPDPNDPSKLSRVTVRTDKGNKEIDASLVIDCTGTAHAGFKMLKRAGYGFANTYRKSELPLDNIKTQYHHHISYSTLRLTIPRELGETLPYPGGYYNGRTLIGCLTDQLKDHRAVYISRIDGDRLQLCAGSWGDAELPRTVAGMKAWAESLVLERPMPQWFFQVLDMLAESEDELEPQVSVVRVPPSCYYRYDRAVNLPSNYIAAGDAIMCVNPVYGQGIAKATFGSAIADSMLREIEASHKSLLEKSRPTLPSDFSKKFFAAQRNKLEPIWAGTKLYDYGYASTEPVAGESISQGGFIRWYLHQLSAISFADKTVSSYMWHARVFLGTGVDLFHPIMIGKVMWSLVFGYPTVPPSD